jgi:hypothetical protein
MIRACRRAAGFPSFPAMPNPRWKFLLLVPVCALLSHCGAPSMGRGNLGGPTVEERNARIASEPTGDFYYGRRYFVEKTRFWGYLRQPRQPWSRAKLVIMREDRKQTPDRLPETGPPGQRYAFDNNYEYRIRGYYTGKEAYDPNSNQFLPEFMLTGYELLDTRPGWLFRPDDRYDRLRITMVPR